VSVVVAVAVAVAVSVYVYLSLLLSHTQTHSLSDSLWHMRQISNTSKIVLHHYQCVLGFACL